METNQFDRRRRLLPLAVLLAGVVGAGGALLAPSGGREPAVLATASGTKTVGAPGHAVDAEAEAESESEGEAPGPAEAEAPPEPTPATLPLARPATATPARTTQPSVPATIPVVPAPAPAPAATTEPASWAITREPADNAVTVYLREAPDQSAVASSVAEGLDVDDVRIELHVAPRLGSSMPVSLVLENRGTQPISLTNGCVGTVSARGGPGGERSLSLSCDKVGDVAPGEVVRLEGVFDFVSPGDYAVGAWITVTRNA
jgi:hypothetical protein